MILLDKTLIRLRTKVLPYMNLVSFVCRGLQASSLKYPNALLSKVLYVNPKKIDAVSSLPIKPKKGSLFFLDGDWDKESISIEYAFNNDYKYSFGKVKPLEPAEWFYTIPDTIEIRGNWDIELPMINIEELYK